MTSTISAQKIGDPLPHGHSILGDRWTSAIVGSKLWFISLNGLNQPTYRSFHQTPLLGGVIATFDIRQRQWDEKRIIYPALSSDENLEGRVFAFRHTLLLLTYQKHNVFSYKHLYYWDETSDRWHPISLYIGPKTELQNVIDTELILTAESDDYVHLLSHDRNRGSIIVSQLDTVGGYGKPGPARIDHMFEIQHAALKGETATVCAAGIHDFRIWTLFFGHDDPAGAAVRLLSTRLKDGETEEVDLSAAVGCGSVLTKSLSDGSKTRCHSCNRFLQNKPTFAHGLSSSQWVFVITSDNGDREIWSIDLREGRWRLLAAPEYNRQSSIADGWSKNAQTRISVPSDVEIGAWNDGDMKFYGISFESGVYSIDVKRVLDEY